MTGDSDADLIDESVGDKKADASFFSSFLPSTSMVSGFGRKWSLPKTPDVVRRIIEAPTPKISRKFKTASSTALPSNESSPKLMPRQRTWPDSKDASYDHYDTASEMMSDKQKKKSWSSPDVVVGKNSFPSFIKEGVASSGSRGSSTSSLSSSYASVVKQQQQQQQQRSSHKRRKHNHHSSSSPIASTGIPGSKKFDTSGKTSSSTSSSSSSSSSSRGADNKSVKTSSSHSLSKMSRFSSKSLNKSHH